MLNFAGKNDLSSDEDDRSIEGFISRTALGNAARTLTLGKLGSGPRYGYMSTGFDSMVLVDTTGLNRAAL